MPNFYLVTDPQGTVFDCVTNLLEAKIIANAHGPGNVVTRLDVEVSVATITKLLGNNGGYAKSSKEVFVS